MTQQPFIYYGFDCLYCLHYITVSLFFFPRSKLLCISFGGSLTHTLTPSPTTEKLLSPRHYHHIDPATGKKLVCNKCPAGTYVSSHCTESSMRECNPCLEGTFTRGENGVEQCHRCQRRCQTPFIEKTPCTSTMDRLCVCPSGSFSQGGKCERHSSCPPGWGVRKAGSETEDVRCRTCQRGTFSDVTSDVLRCRAHMDCQTLGLTLLIKGTEKTDNVCAPTPAGSDSGLVGEAPVSTVSSNESAHRGESEGLCQWRSSKVFKCFYWQYEKCTLCSVIIFN